MSKTQGSYIERTKFRIGAKAVLCSGFAYGMLLCLAFSLINANDLAQAAREKGHPVLGKALERNYVKNREFPGSSEIITFVMLGSFVLGYYLKRKDMDKVCKVFMDQIAPAVIGGDPNLDYDGVKRMGEVLWAYMTDDEKNRINAYTESIATEVECRLKIRDHNIKGIVEIAKTVLERNEGTGLGKILADMARGQTYMFGWNERETLYCTDKSKIQKILQDKIIPQLVGAQVDTKRATDMWEYVWQYMNKDEKMQIRKAKYAANLKDNKSVDSMVATVVQIAKGVINRNSGMQKILYDMSVGQTYMCENWYYFGRAHGA